MYNFNLKWLFIKLMFFASICVGNGHASEGETYRLSRPPTLDANVGNNFVISENGNQTFYLATSTFMGLTSVAAVPTLGGQIVDPTSTAGDIDFRHIRDLEFIVVIRSRLPPITYQVFWSERRPNGGGSVNLNIGVADNSVPVTQLTLSPNKEYVVFVQGGELYSSRIVSGDFGFAHLSENALVTGGVTDFKYAPNGRVFFRATDTDGDFELFSIQPDGTDLRYHDGGYIPAFDASTNVLSYEITPDNRYVVYRIRDASAVQLRYIDQQNGFVITPIVNLPVGGGKQVTQFKISDNSNFVVYRADQNTLGVFELYVFSFDASSSGKLTASPFASTADVFDFAISPDSNRVIYIADEDNDNIRELYSTSIIRNGGPFIIVVKLNPNFSGSRDVASFTIGGNSQYVYYRANQENVGRNEVFRVPINSGAFTKLNHELSAGENVGLFKISGNDSRLVYTVLKSGPDLLYSVETNGGDSVLLTRTANGVDTGQLGVVDFKLSSDNATVVFTAGPFGQRQLFAHSFRRGGAEEVCMPIRAKNGGIAVICL